MRTLKENEWIASRESKAESKGRPVKIYSLSQPVDKIIDVIEKNKQKEVKAQLDLIQKTREHITSQ